ncbi:MAG: transcription termination/antitermination protein NusG [Phycisphaeraceae bacterium]
MAEQQPNPSDVETPEQAAGEQPVEEQAQAPEQAPEAPEASEEQTPEEEPLVTPGMNWFVLRVASNKEDSVRRTLLRKIKIEGFTHLVNRILVPTEKVKTVKGGKQRILEKKLYPGYVFVEMKLEHDGRIPQDVFFLIKETTGVGDFIGTAGRPSPMSLPEIEKMLQASKPAEEQPQVKMEFQPGDYVKIKEGPFENMEGSVDEVLPDQGKVRVIVTIFGRATPIELEHWLVERAED